MKEALEYFSVQLQEIKALGLYKQERIISSPQNVVITTSDNQQVVNFCANNYLGLANHPALKEAAAMALNNRGFGLSSVRFICGTQDLHKQLEKSVADFLHTDDAILYSSCFDANAGLFETLLNDQDAVISDQLNHASIVDGIRLCKATRFRYAHADMEELERILKQTKQYRIRLIATDGVFSMDGDLAKLDRITQLAEHYQALVMVDDSHASGIVGEQGKGSADYYGVMDKVDIYTSTLGKALGGGSGGFTAAHQEIIDLLRQRSRPYLFSNTLPPSLAAAGIAAFKLLSESLQLRQQLQWNTDYFRQAIGQAGFDIKGSSHPIVPVMLYEATLAQEMANRLLAEGIYVIGFFYPVVPKGEARIRVQISAAHSKEHLDKAIEAFIKIGHELAVI